MDKILNKGEMINNTYEVSFFIGAGSFGEVYRVKHKLMGLQAMKVFKKEHFEQENIDEVIAEGKILIRLNHQNIVKVYDINTFNKDDKEYYYITMSFVSGESLAQLLKRKMQLDAPVAISIITDILKGLKHANENDLIAHRDISPDNILLSYDKHKPMGVITDFGIAVLLDKNKKIAGAGGKFLYMAPESLSFDVTSQSSDVFAIGVVLYRILTGVHPWEYDFENYDVSTPRSNMVEMISSTRRSKPKKPSLFNPSVSKNLDDIILKSLDRNMENRYRAASELFEALQNLDKDERPPSQTNIEDAYWEGQNLDSIF